MLNIEIVPCLSDNYSYIIHDDVSGLIGVVDPSEFGTIDKIISKKYKKLDYILNTHHHFDHIGGNLQLKRKYNSKIVCSKLDKERIPQSELLFDENDKFIFGEITFKIISVPGHTKGHIAFFSLKEKVIFTGDALFSMGCGRIFEGNPKQMFESLNKIKILPKETKIYCGHEYTKKNLEFCIKNDPSNKVLDKKLIWVNDKLEKGLATIPVSLEEEICTNIFFRCNNIDVKNNLKMPNTTDELIFKKLRDLKDEF
jgi:hydroxyacylglutathione hydrolase